MAKYPLCQPYGVGDNGCSFGDWDFSWSLASGESFWGSDGESELLTLITQCVQWIPPGGCILGAGAAAGATVTTAAVVKGGAGVVEGSVVEGGEASVVEGSAATAVGVGGSGWTGGGGT